MKLEGIRLGLVEHIDQEAKQGGTWEGLAALGYIEGKLDEAKHGLEVMRRSATAEPSDGSG